LRKSHREPSPVKEKAAQRGRKEEAEGVFPEISIPQSGREIHIVSKKASSDTVEAIWIPHSVRDFRNLVVAGA
jgi:hypothetical protein